MSIWDETFEAAKNVCENATRKASATVSVEKLKIKALSIDKELEKLYAAIGKNCYTRYKNGEVMPDSFFSVFSKIEEKAEELEEIKDKIIEIKGGTVCNSCGKLNLEDSAYCTKCGAKL